MLKRWEVLLDGASYGSVYAAAADAAKRAARAALKRVHPERELEGRLKLGEGQELESEAGEARRIVSEVYEGLRLLPGMELPAEKLRSVLLLLENAVARESAEALGGGGTRGASSGGGGGDTELQEALEPVLEAKPVPGPVKERLKGLLEWVGLNTPDAEREMIELQAFQTLVDAGLVDGHHEDPPPCSLQRTGAYFAQRLQERGVLRVERFPGMKDADGFRRALQPFGAQAAELSWCFVHAGEGEEPVELRRPLVLVGERILQPALLARGVPAPAGTVVELDRILVDASERLQRWRKGPDRLAEPLLTDKQRRPLDKLEKRVKRTRQQMADAAQAGREVLPEGTARRDLMKFLIDQLHRTADALTFLPDQSLREAFDELVFKELVFRGAGFYLNHHFGISIDPSVVVGAEVNSLGGRAKREHGGPRPTRKSGRIHSVVLPCYLQDGATIRPAAVRCGHFA